MSVAAKQRQWQEEEEEEEEEEEGTSGGKSNKSAATDGVGVGYASEIVEEEICSDLFEMDQIREVAEEIENGSSLFSFDLHDNKDCVYVCVGKSQSSMDALSWALKNCALTPSTTIYLIHVFPETHHIPSPLGRLPKSQVNPEQVESYMAQESGKRRELLQKFIDLCSASQVQVETMLIESDEVSKAILDLIPILNMKKLVLGTSKSSLRKMRSKKGTGIADEITENAPEYCEVKLICDGKEVSGLGSPIGDDNSSSSTRLQHQSSNDSFACMCFRSPKVM